MGRSIAMASDQPHDRQQVGTYRGCYLSCMGAVYFVAFASHYLQYPGLLGADGLLPAGQQWRQVRSQFQDSETSTSRSCLSGLYLDLEPVLGWWTQGLLAGAAGQLPRLDLSLDVWPSTSLNQGLLRSFFRYPSWLWFLDALGLHVDQALEGVALLGALLGLLAVFGVHHAIVFLLLHGAYLTLYLAGQRWLGFQWDIFLLETGALTVLYCPLFGLSVRSPFPPGAWLLRVLLVKFMYMNGVVKVTADCPTWQNLTALEYHLASTCLPTSEAWCVHQLPPFLLRLGVAFMFVVELAAPWLLLCPVRTARRLGVIVQALLQIGIIATGNYNWFNFQSLILLLPAWDADNYGDAGDCCSEGRGPLLCRALLWPLKLCSRFWSSLLGRVMALLATCSFLARASASMFRIRLVGGDDPGALQLASSFLQDPIRAVTTDYLRIEANFGVEEVHRLSKFLLSSK
ncbi:unnamed protein product, partial [Polarella glacialis]